MKKQCIWMKENKERLFIIFYNFFLNKFESYSIRGDGRRLQMKWLCWFNVPITRISFVGAFHRFWILINLQNTRTLISLFSLEMIIPGFSCQKFGNSVTQHSPLSHFQKNCQWTPPSSLTHLILTVPLDFVIAFLIHEKLCLEIVQEFTQ